MLRGNCKGREVRTSSESIYDGGSVVWINFSLTWLPLSERASGRAVITRNQKGRAFSNSLIYSFARPILLLRHKTIHRIKLRRLEI